MIADKDVKSFNLGLDSVDSFVLAIAAELENIKSTISWECVDSDNGEPSVEVRLRVFDGGWSILCGDPQFDTDHRGLWGYSDIFEFSDLQDVACAMLTDLENAAMEEFEASSNPRRYYGAE